MVSQFLLSLLFLYFCIYIFFHTFYTYKQSNNLITKVHIIIQERRLNYLFNNNKNQLFLPIKRPCLDQVSGHFLSIRTSNSDFFLFRPCGKVRTLTFRRQLVLYCLHKLRPILSDLSPFYSVPIPSSKLGGWEIISSLERVLWPVLFQEPDPVCENSRPSVFHEVQPITREPASSDQFSEL